MFCKMVGIDCLINFSHQLWGTDIIISTAQIKRQSSERLKQRVLDHTARRTVMLVWILRWCLFPYTLLTLWNACCLSDPHREQHCLGYDPYLLGNVPCFSKCLASGLPQHCWLAGAGRGAGPVTRYGSGGPAGPRTYYLWACFPYRPMSPSEAMTTYYAFCTFWMSYTHKKAFNEHFLNGYWRVIFKNNIKIRDFLKVL